MEAVQKTPEREAFYRKIDGENLSALWNVMGDLITPEPRSACRAHLWKFDAIRDYMTEAGKLITAKEAERRALVTENPQRGVCRGAGGVPGRRGARAPAQPVGIALRARRQGRDDSGRRRTHRD